jgi:hypothetical protein
LTSKLPSGIPFTARTVLCKSLSGDVHSSWIPDLVE